MRKKHNLGKLLAIYPDRQFSWRDLFTLILPGLAACGLPFLYGLYLLETTYSKYGLAVIIPRTYPWIILSLIAFLIFMGLLIYRLILANSYVAIYQGGVLFSRGYKRFLAWEQISAIKSRILTDKLLKKNIHQCLLITKSNRVFQIKPTIQSIDEAVNCIKSHVYPLLLPDMKKKFELGNKLSFGNVIISTEGLEYKLRGYLWKDIKSITIQQGKLVIEFAKSRTLKILASDIPNVELLVDMIFISIIPHYEIKPLSESYLSSSHW